MCGLGGLVTLDLRTHDSGYPQDHRDASRKLKDTASAPAGVDVVIQVNPKQIQPHEGLRYLGENRAHLGSIKVDCSDWDTIFSWLRTLRGEGW